MKLSEAIRVGAKIRPQAHGRLYSEQHPFTWRCFLNICKPIKTSCALGAAFEAADCGSHKAIEDGHGLPFRGEQGKPGDAVEVIEQPTEWNVIFALGAQCPQCGSADIVQRLIPHLNDEHMWKREEIALWVDRIERNVEWLTGDSPEEVAVEWAPMQAFDRGDER